MPEIFDTNFMFEAMDTMLWIIAGGIILIFIATSVILHHHWKTYGVTEKQIKRLHRIYFSVSGILLIAMIWSLLAWVL